MGEPSGRRRCSTYNNEHTHCKCWLRHALLVLTVVQIHVRFVYKRCEMVRATNTAHQLRHYVSAWLQMALAWLKLLTNSGQHIATSMVLQHRTVHIIQAKCWAPHL